MAGTDITSCSPASDPMGRLAMTIALVLLSILALETAIFGHHPGREQQRGKSN
jgi:hypothetical protein